MIQLSKRLQTVAEYIQEHAVVADIGSDHALLPVYLVQSGRAKQAIAGEVNDGPFQAAQKQIANAGLSHLISARKGNGLEVIEANEVNTITICGMGGVLMKDILDAGYKAGKLEGVNQLVLQPNVGEDTVRYWLVEHQFALVDETIVEEDGKIYEILSAVRQTNAADYNSQLFAGDNIELPFPSELKKILLYRMGPILLQKPNEAFVKKWSGEIQKLEQIKKSLEQSTMQTAILKLHSTEQEIKLIKEVLSWLSTVKR